MIGVALKEKAESLGISQSTACRTLGISVGAWLSWTRGITEPKPRFQERIAAFLALEALPDAYREKVASRAMARKERAQAMADLYKQGATLEEIAIQHGITRERVRQLMLGVGVRGPDGGGTVRAKKREAERKAAKDSLFVKRYGMPREEYLAVPKKARTAYCEQKRNAKTREIPWLISFCDWWRIWQESGRWPERGRGRGYVMARNEDSGAYQVGNVYICTGAQNSSDSYQWKPAHARVAKRGLKMYEHEGQRVTLSGLARAVGIKASTLEMRLKRGVPFDVAVSVPAKRGKGHLKHSEIRQ